MSKIVNKLSGIQSQASAEPTLPVPGVETYFKLKEKVSVTLSEGHKQAQSAVEQVKTKTYWNVGQLIDSHVMQSRKRGDYGKKVIQQLSKDLKTNETLLYYALQFARTYPQMPDSKKISWSHYRALLPLKDDKKRESYEVRIEEWGWSSRELEKALSAEKMILKAPETPKNKASEKLISKPGTLFCYRVSDPGAAAGAKYLDLGFGNYYKAVMKSGKYAAGDLVKIVPGKMKNDYRVVRGSTLKQSELFFYGARLEAIHDDLSLTMHVDLGFRLWTRKNLILRGLRLNGLGLKRRSEMKGMIESYTRDTGGLYVRVLPAQVAGCHEADLFCGQTFLNNLLLTSFK